MCDEEALLLPPDKAGDRASRPENVPSEAHEDTLAMDVQSPAHRDTNEGSPEETGSSVSAETPEEPAQPKNFTPGEK
jgi:hypothetical protein